jgi:hypothetical protein
MTTVMFLSGALMLAPPALVLGGQVRAQVPATFVPGTFVPAPVPEPKITTAAPTGACLHDADESPVQRNRRYEAIRYVQALMAAQGEFSSANGRYAQFSELRGLGVPFGFVLLHAATANSYLLSLKDQNDPCGYALYSDHGSTIYAAEPLRTRE